MHQRFSDIEILNTNTIYHWKILMDYFSKEKCEIARKIYIMLCEK